MFNRLLLRMCISFVLRQLDKFHDELDWVKVKSDLDTRVRALIPGEWFDDEAVKVVYFALDSLEEILGKSDLMSQILGLLADKKFDEALFLLKKLLFGKQPISGFLQNEV